MSDTAGQGGEVARRLVAEMPAMTDDRIGALAMENARRNLRYRGEGKSLAALRTETVGGGDSAIVVAAGPSVRRTDPIGRIKAANYRGAVIATESGVASCLRQGLIPDLVVTLDPHATRIVRWFGDPKLSRAALERDDYYRRQDMDATFADELRTNEEVLALVDEHAPRMRVAVATSASEAVVDRMLESGMQVYWWNPMLDDPDFPGSRTRELAAMNRFPCVNAGGNVGTACWMMAHAVLGKRHVAVTGMDFSYYEDTPYERTQYYHEAVDLVGRDNLDSIFVRFRNPHLDRWFYTDPAYLWYRESFLDLAGDADCVTYNCTEGGILYGDGIEFISLDSFLGGMRTDAA